jgi:hypothetical protein
VSTPSPLEHNVILRPTTCRICGHEFQGNSLSTAAVLGENQAAKIQQVQALISPLMKHLQKKHPQQLQWAQMMGGEWGGLLSINFFQCDEPSIERSRDETRWKIHQLTRRVAITDERIEERLRLAYLIAIAKDAGVPLQDVSPSLADDIMRSSTALEILRTMREMRDVMEEKSRYGAPKVPVMGAEANGGDYPEQPAKQAKEAPAS